jgi:hypothetical protein
MKQFILAFFIAAGLMSCSNYGKKVSQDYLEVYYKDGVSKEEAQKTLDFLYPIWKNAEGKTDTKSVQLTKSGDTISFRMVVDKDKLDKVQDETFYIMGNLFSDSLFKGTPVNMVLTDNSFKTIRTLAYKKTEAGNNYGEKVTAGNIEVYAKDGFSLEQAQNLADFLEKQMGSNNTVSFQAGKTDDGGYLVRMVSDEEKSNELGDEPFNKMAAELSENVFNGGHVTFELTDNKFNTFKTFESKTQ